MHKRDYFIAAMNAGSYRHKRWVLEAFSVVLDLHSERLYPYALILEGDEKPRYGFVPPGSDVVETLDGTTVGTPPFSFHDELVVGPNDIPNLKKNITTTYGNVLANFLCLIYPFGNKVEYLEGRITIDQIEKIIEERLIDDPIVQSGLNKKIDVPSDPTALTVKEYIKFNEAALSLAGYAQLCVPAGSPRTLTTDPQVAVRRKELLEQYKDQLDDPAIQARISDELIAIDKAWVKGDVSEGFYLKDKSYDVVRKKMLLMLGAEAGFGVKGSLITSSLNDGWDIKHLPAMNNSLREGSFNRGAQTALGGEATKFNYRIFQNTTVIGKDCGTKLGLPITLTADIIDGYVSSTAIRDGEMIEITKENKGDFVGKPIMIRSPAYCIAEAPSFCATCIGTRIALTPTAIGTYAADVGSKFMSLFMAATHGTALKTKNYLLTESIG